MPTGGAWLAKVAHNKTWGSQRGKQDKVIAAAIVDRLTFKAYIIDMNGPSYRIKATEKWMKERKMKQKPEK